MMLIFISSLPDITFSLLLIFFHFSLIIFDRLRHAMPLMLMLLMPLPLSMLFTLPPLYASRFSCRCCCHYG